MPHASWLMAHGHSWPFMAELVGHGEQRRAHRKLVSLKNNSVRVLETQSRIDQLTRKICKSKLINSGPILWVYWRHLFATWFCARGGEQKAAKRSSGPELQARPSSKAEPRTPSKSQDTPPHPIQRFPFLSMWGYSIFAGSGWLPQQRANRCICGMSFERVSGPILWVCWRPLVYYIYIYIYIYFDVFGRDLID